MRLNSAALLLRVAVAGLAAIAARPVPAMAATASCGTEKASQDATAHAEAGTVDIHGTVLRLRQGGLIIKPSTKSTAGQRILELPTS